MELKFIFDRLKEYRNRKCILMVFKDTTMVKRTYGENGYEVDLNKNKILLSVNEDEFIIEGVQNEIEFNDEETRKTQIRTKENTIVINHFF